jgi:hypothetical protein
MLISYGARLARRLPKEAFAMAASPVSIPSGPVSVRRRALALTARRLEANRRNAARSTGPRSPAGKARVARNAIKHGFFVTQERWTPTQRRNLQELLEGLRDDFQPHGILEESCVATIAASYVRMAAMLRYENIAAFQYHQQCERELNQRIATAEEAEAARLEAHREQLRRAGLWVPTIPGPREARAIIRYGGSLDRAIRRATSELEGLKALRTGGISRNLEAQKQTHFEASQRSDHEAAQGPRTAPFLNPKMQKQTHFEATARSVLGPDEGPQVAPPSSIESAKTNPLSSMFTGNRHQRRRARALAKRERTAG